MSTSKWFGFHVMQYLIIEKLKLINLCGTNTSCYSWIGEKHVRETIVRGINPGPNNWHPMTEKVWINQFYILSVKAEDGNSWWVMVRREVRPQQS